MAQMNHTVDTQDTQEGFDIIPAGEYIAVIESSDLVPTKAGTGEILKLTYQIIDGPQKGKKLFNNLNLKNPNQQAVQIATRSLNSIGVAVGVTDIKDSSQLHNIPMKIDVMVKDDATYGKQNNIKKHIPMNKDSEPIQTEAVPGKQSQPAKQPWE